MRKLTPIFGAVAAAALLAGGWWLWKSNTAKPRRSHEVVTVKEGAIESTVEATGSVLPLNRVEIKPPIAGRVEQLLAAEGDKVQAGQILAWMSSSDRAAILDAARAQGPEELKRWQDVYKPTPIVAPLSGVVILRNVVVGQTVDASTVLFAMSDKLVVVAQVDESDVGRVRAGMTAKVTLDSFPDRTVEGRVFDILFEGKNVSNVIQYGVKIAVDPVPAWFRSQMTANVSFVLDRKAKTLLLPAAAVRDGRVLLPGADGRPPESREIKTGVESGDQIEVLEGLSAGDRVLVARSRYVPQQGPQSSPLMMGGRGGQGRPSPQGEGGGRRRGTR